MGNTHPASTKFTQLKDRILWFDGTSTVPEKELVQLIAREGSVDGMFVDEMSQDIKQYNLLVPDHEKITVKGSVYELSLEWNIPHEFSELNVRDHIINCFEDECNSQVFTDDELHERSRRIIQELDLYESLGLFGVIRTLIFVINTLRERDIVWGVGRGSSVASYILYLIGVHDVDSVLYELDITDFLRK